MANPLAAIAAKIAELLGPAVNATVGKATSSSLNSRKLMVAATAIGSIAMIVNSAYGTDPTNPIANYLVMLCGVGCLAIAIVAYGYCKAQALEDVERRKLQAAAIAAGLPIGKHAREPEPLQEVTLEGTVPPPPAQ